MFGLSQIQTVIVAGLLAAVLVGGGILYIYHKGEKSGASEVTTKVQAETVKTLDKARTEKEKANETVRNTPLDVLVDGLK